MMRPVAQDSRRMGDGFPATKTSKGDKCWITNTLFLAA